MEAKVEFGIVLADDQSASVEMLLRLLDSLPLYKVLISCSNGKEAIDAVASFHPRILILDIMMPVMNGIEAAREVALRFPQTRIIFVTGQTSRAYVKAAFDAGASAYVRKELADDDLAPALAAVLAGSTFLSRGLQR